MEITLSLSPITPLDVHHKSPSLSPPIIGHPIPWNSLKAHDLEEEPAPTTRETSAPPAPKTAKQLAARRNQERVKSILLLAIPDEYLLKFHNVADAKSLWEAIKSRFGGNVESKKMQKNVHGAPISKEDINQKFLRSLPSSWNQIALIMRNKPDIDEIDIDDLYNNLRVYEDELKRSSGSNSASQNLAFLSSENTGSTNEVSTASGDFGVSTAGGINQVPSTPCAHDIAYSFLAQPTTSPQLENEDFQQMDGDDLEELDLRWQVAMLTVRVKKLSATTVTEKGILLENVDLEGVKEEDLMVIMAGAMHQLILVAQDGLGGYDWSNDFDLELVNYALMAISSSILSSSSDSKVQQCPKCLESFKCLQKNYDTEREKHNKAKLEIRGYEIALESLESKIIGHEKKELAWGKKYEFQNYELKCREIKINNLNLESEKAIKERDELKDKIAKWEESNKNLEEILKSQMSARDKTGLGYSTQLNELSGNHETDSENSLSIFYGRSTNDEHIPENDRFSKNGYKAVPLPITGNFLTPRADISFAGLDEYAIMSKIIESQTTELNNKTSETASKTNDANTEKPKSVSKSVVSNPNINRDSVIIEDWTSDDEEEVSGVKVKACFVCRSTEHLIKDCNFHDKKSQESNLKNVVNTGKWEIKPVWDNTKRVNHPNFSKYPHLSETFVPAGVSSKTGLHRPSINTARSVYTARPSINTARPVSTIRPSISTARPIYTARPVSTVRPSISTARPVYTARPNISTVRPVYASRSIYPRMENIRPKGSCSPIKRSYYTKPAFRPKDLKQDVKTFRVKNITTTRKRAIVNTGKGKLDIDLKESRWVWRPKGNYLDQVSKDSGSFMLKKGNSEILLHDHAVVDIGCSSHMTGKKAYLLDYEDLNGGFVAFGSDPKGEGEEPEDQGRIIQDIDDDPLVSLVRESMKMKEKSTDFVTPTKALGEAQEEDISPTILEAAKTLSKINTGRVEINTGIEEVSTGSAKVDSGTASKRGQREGKAPMVEEDIQATHKTKEQIRQEEAGLEEAIKLQAQMDEEVAKQIHLDEMIAKRMAEEEALSEQQKKRKAQVQFEAQYYTEEDWDAIRAKLEANAELTKDVLGKDLPEQDFAKRMVDMVNQRKKHFAEERAKAKRNKPMTQSQLRIYMSNYLKNQGTWKLSQLKKLSFEEIKEEFDKLVQQIDTFVPMDFEATKAKLKRYGEELQTKTSKKQKIDDKDVPAIGEKVAEVKEEEPVKRTGKRKKQKARKGISVDKNAQGDSETDKEESVEAMNPTPLATKSNIVVNWKIFQQGQRSIYQIMRANGADTVYMSFGAMIKDFTREDLIELYRLVMQKYGTNRPEDAYDRVLWSDLRTMFDPPLNEDAIWSLPLQQKMISWRYYDKCAVHCLTLEASTIYMLADRKYPLSKDACQVMLKMKLLDGTMDEVCYKLLKMIKKQAGIRK
ncbi:hypothetical protein Tco_0694255 [Tanacetum coccineum]